ncbi:MAG: GGDEF domain-containing protein [Pseudomonadales bacterium]
MRIRIRNRRELWLYIMAVTLISVAVTELTLLGIYLLFGKSVFSATQAFYTAAIVPILVTVPVCYLTARMAVQLNEAHARLRELAHTDELTGLTNRRSFFQRAETVLGEARDADEHVSLLVIDADHFKQLNDTYGHATGDAALQFITEQLSTCVRKTDLLCRLGGEEFAVLLPDMDGTEATKLAERIVERVASRPMVWDGKIIEMSVSCGIADTRSGRDMTALFKAADDALYAAKHNGRNRHMHFTELRRSGREQRSASQR